MINGKHGQGTHNTKMVADKSAENTQMPQRLAAQIVCPSLGIGRKIASWASVVRVREQENEVGLVFFSSFFLHKPV